MGEIIEGVTLVYTCAAWPPLGLSLIKTYQLGKDSKGTFVNNSDHTEYIEYEVIKMFFTPKGGKITWTDIEKANPNLVEVQQ